MQKQLPVLRRQLPRGGQAGFSLIEILIVVALIGLIAGLVANQVFGGRDRAQWNLAKTQIQSLGAKIEQYEMDNGGPPGQLEDLIRQPGGAKSWLGPYAKESELKDPWNRQIEYRNTGEGNYAYQLISYGKDGKPGGDSWNRDISNTDD
jgi:general secretion pathway protein G